MEFTRYAEDTSKTISETDFCRHLLYSSNISQKKKEKMIKIVADKFEGKGTEGGISFESFKTFYYVLFGENQNVNASSDLISHIRGCGP